MEKIEIIKYLNELPKEKETLKLRLESAEVIIKHVPESAFKTALESGKILSVGDARGNQYIKHELGNEDLTKIVETGSSSYLKLLSSKIESIEKKITVIIVNIKPIDLSAIFDGLSDSSRLMIAREIIKIKEVSDKTDIFEPLIDIIHQRKDETLRSIIENEYSGCIIYSNAETVDKAKKNIESQIPKGFSIKNITVLEDGNEITKEFNGWGGNINDDLNRIRAKLTNEHSIITEETIVRNDRASRFIKYYAEELLPDNDLLFKSSKWRDKYVPKIEIEEDEIWGNPKLIKKATNGFLGLGKKTNQYQSEIFKPPKAIIKYKHRAEIKVELHLQDF
mgnify:CR=1 FL=1